MKNIYTLHHIIVQLQQLHALFRHGQRKEDLRLFSQIFFLAMEMLSPSTSSYLLLNAFSVEPGAFPPFGTNLISMPSKRYAYPALPASSPFFAQPIQPKL